MAYNASQVKSPVCYNLDNTDWQAYVGGYTFSFSTMRHRDKFLSEAEKRVQWMNHSMSNRFHIPCRFDRLALVQLYMMVEGRGFLVVDENAGEVYRNPDDMLASIDIVMNMSGE